MKKNFLFFLGFILIIYLFTDQSNQEIELFSANKSVKIFLQDKKLEQALTQVLNKQRPSNHLPEHQHVPNLIEENLIHIKDNPEDLKDIYSSQVQFKKDLAPEESINENKSNARKILEEEIAKDEITLSEFYLQEEEASALFLQEKINNKKKHLEYLPNY